MKQVTQQYKQTEKWTKERLEEIMRIKEEDTLTAESIIKHAKKKNNPLHDLFNWDDTEAANLWRLHQSRMFVNEIRVIIEEKEYYAFENVSVVVGETPSRVYMERSEILDDSFLRKQMITKAYDALKYWEEQYKSYEEFNPVFNAIRVMDKQMKGEN